MTMVLIAAFMCYVIVVLPNDVMKMDNKQSKVCK